MNRNWNPTLPQCVPNMNGNMRRLTERRTQPYDTRAFEGYALECLRWAIPRVPGHDAVTLRSLRKSLAEYYRGSAPEVLNTLAMVPPVSIFTRGRGGCPKDGEGRTRPAVRSALAPPHPPPKRLPVSPSPSRTPAHAWIVAHVPIDFRVHVILGADFQ